MNKENSWLSGGDEIRLRLSKAFVENGYSLAAIEELKPICERLVVAISKIKFSKIRIEVSLRSKAIIFSLLIGDDDLVMITKPLAEPVMDEGTVVFSLFQKRERIASDCVDIDMLVEGLSEYFKETKS